MGGWPPTGCVSLLRGFRSRSEYVRARLAGATDVQSRFYGAFGAVPSSSLSRCRTRINLSRFYGAFGAVPSSRRRSPSARTKRSRFYGAFGAVPSFRARRRHQLRCPSLASTGLSEPFRATLGGLRLQNR